MNGSLKLVAPLIAAVAIAACNGGTTSIPSGSSQTTSAFTQHIPEWQAKHEAKAACPQVVNKPTCLVLFEHKVATPLCSPSSTCGWTPSELETRYGLTPYLGNGSGTQVAVIEVGDYSDAASDLATYRTEFGLGTATINRYNENGDEGSYPSSCQDYGWCLETALDIDMVSAACPKCTIDLMEADDSISGLETAEASAVTLGATIISNSWICYKNWDCSDTSFPNYFDSSGVTYLASSGDDGYGEIGGPSVLDSVIAVGGTQLKKSGSTYSETIWSDAGAGCANAATVGESVSKPSYQHDPDCTSRTDADVSAEAGCEPGVAEYSTFYSGWVDVCGTSVASPLTGGIIAVAGNGGKFQGGGQFWSLSKKAHKKDFNVITSGDDGFCSNEYLCEAGLKKKHGGYETYSGPGGWGTANGITAY